MIEPTLDYEFSLARDGYRVLIGLDEVGRGALAGPVSVGAVAVDLAEVAAGRIAPTGVRDSKLLSPARRAAASLRLPDWTLARAVGSASPAEIDAHGITRALGMAGWRALAPVLDTLGAAVETPGSAVILVDGNHDWLSPVRRSPLPVHVRVKADATVMTVAGASVLAKVERDAEMTRLDADFPQFGWAGNKGYGSASHRAAIRVSGPCEQHRRTWRLV